MSSTATAGVVERPDDDGQELGAAGRGDRAPSGRRVGGRFGHAERAQHPAARRMVATSTVCSSTMSAPTRDLSSSGVPWAMTRPPSMMTMEAARWSASSRYCVVRMMSVPARPCPGCRPTPRCGSPGRGRSSARRAAAGGASRPGWPRDRAGGACRRSRCGPGGRRPPPGSSARGSASAAATAWPRPCP